MLVAVGGFSTNERLVDFDRLTLATHRREIAVSHRRAEAVRHEPSRFQGHAQDAGKLIAANALLAAAKQVRRLEPDMERDRAVLEHRPDPDRELLAAGVALPEA